MTAPTPKAAPSKAAKAAKAKAAKAAKAEAKADKAKAKADKADKATTPAKATDAAAPLLEVVDLKTHFFTDEGVLPSVDGVSFHIGRGETLGVVGESGCGKSVTAMSILQLIPQPPGRIVGGKIRFDGRDLLALSGSALRRVRGNDIAMIFQEPMTSLNPVYTVGNQICEALMLHQKLDYDDARARAIQTLEHVGIPAPERRIDEYPHQMSGGMKQRVMIAMALSCDPKLLIADEPTTALDVTIQAQILELLSALQRERDMAVLLITHDLGVVAETCRRVVVMYAGRVAETAPTEALFDSPAHPYTKGLMDSLPDMSPPGSVLPTIRGSVPSPLAFPSGCRFRNRCPRATDVCATTPPRVDVGPGHIAYCHHPLAGEITGGDVDASGDSGGARGDNDGGDADASGDSGGARDVGASGGAGGDA